MNREEKNRRISESKAKTKERRKDRVCLTYEIKVVTSKLSRAQKDDVNQVYREAKWVRNAAVCDFKSAVRDPKSVKVKVGEDFEERKLEILGSGIKQEIYDKVKSEIKGLSTKKKKGEKVGALKPKSYCNTIYLKQYGNTYSIDFEHNRIKVQNIKKPFYVRGLKQIPKDAEITCAKLTRKASGLYFYITVYVDKKEVRTTGEKVGIDFGIEHNMTLSNGQTFDVCVPESKAVKLASKRLNKAWVHNGRKTSNRQRKLRAKLNKAYEKNTNRRLDIGKKVVHELLTSYDFIAVQNEMIHNWQAGLFGKQVQYSAMGFIIAELKKSSKTHIVERSFPSTQICPVCGRMTKHPLDKRDYDCLYCGYHHDSRDEKSATSILDEALRQVSLEQGAQSLVEAETATSISHESKSTRKSSFKKREAQVL